jgi:hypothetical protein
MIHLHIKPHMPSISGLLGVAVKETKRCTEIACDCYDAILRVYVVQKKIVVKSSIVFNVHCYKNRNLLYVILFCHHFGSSYNPHDRIIEGRE